MKHDHTPGNVQIIGPSFICDGVALGGEGALWIAGAPARELADVKAQIEQLLELVAEYDEAYAAGQDGAARMIWQSMKQGPGGTPDWNLREWQRPGGGWYWQSGDRTVPFDWPSTPAKLDWGD